MKKIYSTILLLSSALLMACSSVSSEVASSATSSSSQNQTTSSSQTSSEAEETVFDIDFKNMRLDIGDANSLAIVKKTNKNNKKFSASEKNDEPNILVKSTHVKYENGDIDVNDDNQLEVTFIKTETKTTEKIIKGEQNYLSFGATSVVNDDGTVTYNDDAHIIASAIDGYTYSLYDGETLVADPVTFKANGTENTITFEGLKQNYTYVLKYEGIGVETTSTSVELGAELDKMFVYNSDFTFLSFVPLGSSIRYSVDDLNEYDREHYFTNPIRISVVVNNKTGLIYKIENFHIYSFLNNLIISEGLMFDFKVDENDNLVFYSLFANKNINAHYGFKDKFGNKVIYNDKLNLFVESTNTRFYKNKFDDEGYMYFFTSSNEILYFKKDMWKKAFDCYLLTEDGRRSLNANDKFYMYSAYGPEDDYNHVFYVKNMKMYTISCHDKSVMVDDIAMKNSYFVQFGGSIDFCEWFKDYDVITILYKNDVYYAKNWISIIDSFVTFEENSSFNEYKINISYEKVIKSFTLLFKNAEYDEYKHSYTQYGPNGDTYYEIIITKNENDCDVTYAEYGTYVPPKEVVFNPINR